MQVKKVEDGFLMHQSIRCVNDTPSVPHYVPTFEQISDNEYKCTNCGTILVVKEPVLVLGEEGRLRVEVHVQEKGVNIDGSK